MVAHLKGGGTKDIVEIRYPKGKAHKDNRQPDYNNESGSITSIYCTTYRSN